MLTNNPDKVEALREQGLTVAGTEPLEFEPSPYNLAYLTSKAAGGHRLRRLAATQVRRAPPPEPVIPFKPHALPGAQRFIAAASYFLPVRPVDHDVIVPAGDLEAWRQDGSLERVMAGPRPLVLGHRAIRGGRCLVRVDPDALARRPRGAGHEALLASLITPYWFRVHVYYDIVSSQEFVALTYGHPDAKDHPAVYLHSETLFERFPLRAARQRDAFGAAVKEIVAYGSGAILLVHHTGSGGGFGTHAAATMLIQSGESASEAQARNALGVGQRATRKAPRCGCSATTSRAAACRCYFRPETPRSGGAAWRRLWARRVLPCSHGPSWMNPAKPDAAPPRPRRLRRRPDAARSSGGGAASAGACQRRRRRR